MSANTNQLDILTIQEEAKKDPIFNTCCVVINGTCQNVAWEDLFDYKRYNHLDCVTYVSSTGFFAKVVDGFDSVRIIIGIDKEDVRKSFYKGLSNRVHSKGTAFFEELSDKTKEKLINAELTVRFSKPDSVIHSKFYLLSNTTNDDTRLIIGSANLTNTAFDNRIDQYEDVIVLDNDPLFDVYKKRFNAIYEVILALKGHILRKRSLVRRSKSALVIQKQQSYQTHYLNLWIQKAIV